MKKIKKEIKIIAAAVAVGLALAFSAAAGMTYVYSETAQADIARNVLRFHVIANSDSDADQLLKTRVRDAVLKEFEPELNASGSVDETRAFLSGHMAEIERSALSVIRGYGYDYAVDVSIGEVFFPTRVYGDVVFPPGVYESLRIVIGNGGGKNWWCVMFPPLCYVDATRDVLPEEGKQQLKSSLSEEEYKLLTYTSRDNSIKIKFKIVEWWQNRKLQSYAAGIIVNQLIKYPIYFSSRA